MIPWRNLRRFFYKALKQPAYSFRVFQKRLKAYMYYFIMNGRSSLPESVTLFLTHRCNLCCKMCGQWGESGVTKKQSTQYLRSELSLDELKGIIDDLSHFKPSITLFGGEPLLHPGCIDIIRHIKEKGMHCLMITNGSLLEESAEGIVAAGLDELNLSLDGGPQLHDSIRGMPGLFAKIMRGLKKINYFKTTANKKIPFINLQCTITKYNYKHLEQLIGVANEAGASSLTFHNLIFLSRKLVEEQKEYDEILKNSSLNWEGFVFEPEINTELLYKKMREILSVRHRFSVDFYPNFSLKGLRDYYNNPAYLPSEYPSRCISPWIVAYVFPDGRVCPCLNFSYSYGNIKDKNFSELWNNDSAVKFRRLLKEKGLFPVCARCTELYRY